MTENYLLPIKSPDTSTRQLYIPLALSISSSLDKNIFHLTVSNEQSFICVQLKKMNNYLKW